MITNGEFGRTEEAAMMYFDTRSATEEFPCRDYKKKKKTRKCQSAGVKAEVSSGFSQIHAKRVALDKGRGQLHTSGAIFPTPELFWT
jgi:hypothetical protein